MNGVEGDEQEQDVVRVAEQKALGPVRKHDRGAKQPPFQRVEHHVVEDAEVERTTAEAVMVENGEPAGVSGVEHGSRQDDREWQPRLAAGKAKQAANERRRSPFLEGSPKQRSATRPRRPGSPGTAADF